MKLIKVYVEDGLHEKLKQRAGDIPLSKWMRMIASREVFLDPPLTPEQSAKIEELKPRIGDIFTVKLPQRLVEAQKACSHGVLKGYRCWQCGGLAQIS